MSFGGQEFALAGVVAGAGASAAGAAGAAGAAVVFGVRPEDLRIAAPGETGITAVIDLVEELGADGYLYGHVADGDERRDIVARVDGRNHPTAGETVTLVPDMAQAHLFDAESGERLN